MHSKPGRNDQVDGVYFTANGVNISWGAFNKSGVAVASAGGVSGTWNGKNSSNNSTVWSINDGRSGAYSDWAVKPSTLHPQPYTLHPTP